MRSCILTGCLVAHLLSGFQTRASAQNGFPGDSLLGGRLGATVDVHSREYFNLFPFVRGFQSASADAVNDSVRVRFEQSAASRPGQRSSVMMGGEELSNLSRYVDRFEELASGNIDVRYDLIRNLARFRSNYRTGQRIDVHRKSGSVESGRLLTANPSHLLLLRETAGKDYRWRRDSTPDMIDRIGLDEVDQISLYRSGFARLSSIAVLGGAATAVGILPLRDSPSVGQYSSLGVTAFSLTLGVLHGFRKYTDISLDDRERAAATLQEGRAIVRGMPPELSRLLEDGSRTTTTAPHEADRPAIRGVYLTIGNTLLLSHGGQPENSLPVAAVPKVTGMHDSPAALVVDVAADVSRRVSVGTEVLLAPKPNTRHEYEYVYGVVTTLYTEYEVRPPRLSTVSFFSRSSVGVGVGVSYHRLSSLFRLDNSKLDPVLLQVNPALADADLEETEVTAGITGYARLSLTIRSRIDNRSC